MEDNKLIAEFMGDDYEAIVFSAKDDLYAIGHRNDVYIDANYKLYHNSWDWLMPVVEKIENLPYMECGNAFQVVIFEEEVSIMKKDPVKWVQIVDIPANGDSKIQVTYNAVVEFIKWYNTQNK